MRNLKVKILQPPVNRGIRDGYHARHIRAKESIPCQEDVKRWSHLDDIFIQKIDVHVGLLVRQDAHQALERKESRRRAILNENSINQWTSRNNWSQSSYCELC